MMMMKPLRFLMVLPLTLGAHLASYIEAGSIHRTLFSDPVVTLAGGVSPTHAHVLSPMHVVLLVRKLLRGRFGGRFQLLD